MNTQLTKARYNALKKHLVLISRADLPEGDNYPYTENGTYPANCFPCFRFVAGTLAEKDETIENLILCGRRNPWNCAQIIAAMMPQVLELLDIED